MALVFLDSFDDRYFATGASYASYHTKWTTVTEDSGGGYLLEQVTGRTGKACKLGGTSSLKKNISNQPISITWGMAIKVTSAPVSETEIISIEVTYNETETDYYYYKLTQTLDLKLYRNGDYLGTSEPDNPLVINEFAYVESIFSVSGTPSLTLQKNGTNWVDNAAASIQASGVSYAEVWVNSITFKGGITIDDLYLSDSGSYIGQIKIDALVPTSNGTADTNAWQSISYTDVDECFQLNHDANSTYDESNTASPSRVSYNFDDQSDKTIYGVQTICWVAGFWNSIGFATNVDITAITRVASTYYESNTISASSSSSPSYSILIGLWANNPNTSTSWTTTTFNGAEFGVKALPSSNNIGRLTAITLELAYISTTPAQTSRIFIIS